ANAAVVEDASSGVEAGRNAGFALVIGLAREDNKKDLLDHYADVAMDDLSRINLDWVKKWMVKEPPWAFDVWDDSDKVAEKLKPLTQGHDFELNDKYKRTPKEAVLSGKKLVFFLDYDGTLTPIVSRPDLAVLSQEMKALLTSISKKHITGIVSGRGREDVQRLVGIDGLFYAGSHGFDIQGPNLSMIEPRAAALIPKISAISEQVSDYVKNIQGALIENKRFSLAVHYRLVQDEYVPKIQEFVGTIVANDAALRLMYGKKVFEIMPAIDWDKGKAMRWVMRALNIDWPDATVIYIGDDTTDEDAFRFLRGRGVGILVSDRPRASAADFRLSGVDEVKKFFEQILI
ncbi:MAG: trehalose-phosphatase, partial [Candidatus Omnitrophota bacterium]